MREGTRLCGAPSSYRCAKTTREGKPFCPDHVWLNPYVCGLLCDSVVRLLALGDGRLRREDLLGLLDLPETAVDYVMQVMIAARAVEIADGWVLEPGRGLPRPGTGRIVRKKRA